MSGIGSKRNSKDADLSNSESQDENITSDSGSGLSDSGYETPEEISSDEEYVNENETEKRRRLAHQYLENIRTEANEIATAQVAAKRQKIDKDIGTENATDVQIDEYNNFDAADLERELLEKRLYKDNLSQEGKLHKFIAADFANFNDLKKNNKSIMMLKKKQFNRSSDYLTCMDAFQENQMTTLLDLENNNMVNNNTSRKPFLVTVSKNFTLTKYDLSRFDKRLNKLKQVKIGDRSFKKELKTEHDNNTLNHYSTIYSVAVAPNGKTIVTGGKDRKLIIWSGETLQPLKAIPTKDRKGEINSMCFRNNSDQLFVACRDYKIRVYNTNQFQQMETLFGHQGPITDVSVLNMERCVSVGSYDKSLMLWKLQDESRLVFKLPQQSKSQQDLKKNYLKKHANSNKLFTKKKTPNFFPQPTKLNLCKMIDDTHYVTATDDGSLQLWATQKKRPLCHIPQAHGFKIKNNLKVSAESDKLQVEAQRQIQRDQGNSITAVCVLAYSDLLISGSCNGEIILWKIDIETNNLFQIGSVDGIKGIVISIKVIVDENEDQYRVLVGTSKEEKEGRWDKVDEGRNGVWDIVIARK